MKNHKLQSSPLLLGAAFLLAASSASAQLTITNGDFETLPATGGDPYLNVESWFDLDDSGGNTEFWSTASQNAFLSPTADYGAFLGDGGGTAIGVGDRYIYQEIGTKEAGLTYSLSFDYGQPTDGNVNRAVAATYEIFAGSFTGADDSDITGLTSITSGTTSTTSIVGEGIFENFSTTLDLSSATITDTLWLRIANAPGAGTDNGSWLFVDNVAITAVPEPGSFALLAGLFALGFMAVRRRK